MSLHHTNSNKNDNAVNLKNSNQLYNSNEFTDLDFKFNSSNIANSPSVKFPSNIVSSKLEIGSDIAPTDTADIDKQIANRTSVLPKLRTEIYKNTYSLENKFKLEKYSLSDETVARKKIVSDILRRKDGNSPTVIAFDSLKFTASRINFDLKTILSIILIWLSSLAEIINRYLFKLANSLLELFDELPSDIKQNYFDLIEFVETIRNSQTRELWFLETKLDTQYRIGKVYTQLANIWMVVRKAYLSLVVVLVLVFLQLAAGASQGVDGLGLSPLDKFVSNNSYRINSSILVSASSDTNSVILTGSSLQNAQTGNSVKRIVSHNLRPNDSLERLSEMYGVSIDTITYNNRIETNDLSDIEFVYIPWSDGYIYSVNEDISPATLSDIYDIDQQLLIEQNQDLLDPESGLFYKGSLVLLPSKNISQIQDILNKEDERKENLEQAELQRQETLAYTAVETSVYKAENPEQVVAPSTNFIWPTTGTISRCLQPGHIACDIASFAAPDIFTVQQGTVEQVQYSGAGYGNMVVVNHGNGIRTLYAHMQEIYVTTDQVVQQGTPLGKMGCTGICTGTHLHFEVINNGVKHDPLLYLP